MVRVIYFKSHKFSPIWVPSRPSPTSVILSQLIKSKSELDNETEPVKVEFEML